MRSTCLSKKDIAQSKNHNGIWQINSEILYGPSAFEALNSFGSILASGERIDDDAAPKGFINILVFDKNYNLVDVAFWQIPEDNVQDGPVKAFYDPLTVTATIRQAGYAYVFLSNEGVNEQQIAFDDYEVEHVHSDVIQSEEYYPFGLTFNGYQKENSVANLYQYNGKEKQDELSLGWLDYGARMDMPEIGRWGGVDPLAGKSRRWSPYNFSYNNPIRFIDRDGMQADDFGNVTFAGYTAPGEGGTVTGTSIGGSSKSVAISKSSFGKAWSASFKKNYGGKTVKNLDRAYAKFVRGFVQSSQSGPGVRFATKDDAAIDWGKNYNDNSIVSKREYASTIFEKNHGDNVHYSYTKPRVGSAAESHRSRSGIGIVDVGDIHSHANFELPSDDSFSIDDIKAMKENPEGWDSYLTTPMGALFKYGNDEPISIDMPSDPGARIGDLNLRRNSIDATKGPKNEPVFELMDWLKLINPD